MSDYSKSPADLLRTSVSQGYVGVRVQQGVPILDRDLNLMNDLVAAMAREVFSRYIGNGNATGDDGFAVRASPDGANENDFTVTAGACLVDGIECVLADAITYSGQHLDDELHTPTTGPRTDCVYLDVTLVEVDGSHDPDLLNRDDVGIETSVRVKPLVLVLVNEGADHAPAPAKDHHHHPLALLRRPAGQAAITGNVITDLRQHRLTVADMEKRLSVMERLLATPRIVDPEFTPRSGKVGQTIAINGERFDVGAVKVLFGNQPAAKVANPGPTGLAVKVPPGLTPNGVPAKVWITVRNDVGKAVSQSRFTVTAEPVLVDYGAQFTPDHGVPDTTIDIHGFNLDVGGPPTVTFGTSDAAPAANVIQHSDTLVRVTVPQHLVPDGQSSSSLQITVKTSAGTVTSDAPFTAELPVPRPVFAGTPFTPQKGAAGDIVNINGMHFDVGSLKVFFGETGGLQAPTQGTPSATQIVVAVPAEMPLGAVRIRVETIGGTAVSPTVFTVTPPFQ